jgi:hypothetical protein
MEGGRIDTELLSHILIQLLLPAFLRIYINLASPATVYAFDPSFPPSKQIQFYPHLVISAVLLNCLCLKFSVSRHKVMLFFQMFYASLPIQITCTTGSSTFLSNIFLSCIPSVNGAPKTYVSPEFVKIIG